MWGGIECTLNRVGDRYFDQTEWSGHARRPDDLDRIAALGVRTQRYPVLWEKVAPDGTTCDWTWTDERLGRLRRLGVRPILGLVHHGSGPRRIALTEPSFAEGLAAFARQVAERYPWADHYTPVNEPLTTARFSGLYGMTESDYDFFMNQDCRYRCIMGTDYYMTNEHLLRPDGSTIASGEFFGYYIIAKQYYDRYGLPLMHTETNIKEQEGSVQWLWKEWNTMLRLREDGVPIIGFTSYSLTDQIDWDVVLRVERNRVHPVGLYDLQRKQRKVGKDYRRLIREWREFLPAGTSALMLV